MKQRVKEIASIVGFVTIIIVICAVFGEMLTPITYATYFNHDMELVKESETEVDLVLIGASRTYRHFVPSVIEEVNGYKCVINAGSSSQSLSGTYYQLKDLLVDHKVKEVGIDVHSGSLLDGENQTAKLIVLDRLKGIVKGEFIQACFPGEELLWASDMYRYRNSVTGIMGTHRAMKALKASDYAPQMMGNEYYADTGFVYSYDTWQTGTIPIRSQVIWKEEEIRKENLEYLDKCIELCKEHGVTVFLHTGVTSMMRMYNSEGIQEMTDYYTEYAKKNGLIYHNYNLLKDRELIYPDEIIHQSS